ncbi:MAG: hypothetical protein ABIK68_21540, partial [bacterium]
LECLDGISVSLFDTCPACTHWFLKATKRKKFCSAKCSSLYNVRKKRKDPAYREKENERLREAYDKKVRKDHPNAKI